MRVDGVSLQFFRNYREENIKFAPGINVITGQNAQGKTNLLESIYLLSCGHGFRTRTDRELISFSSDYSRIIGDVYSGGRQQSINVLMGQATRKQIHCNGVKRTAAELSEIVRVVLFCPDDLNMIRDGAKARRRFMDMAISQLRPNYQKILTEYTKLYEHKKRILSDWREKPSLLDALDEFSLGLAKCSAQLIRYRAAFAKRLVETAVPIHREFSGSDEELSIVYKTISTVSDPLSSAGEIFEEILQHQASHREAEIASGNVLSGIHKDDLEICINGVCARTYASQGQTRTAALSLKMAEREISLQDTGDTPILLLDDVLSELDSKRQEYVLNRIGGGQTLITCCEDEQIKKRTGGRVITINGGCVQP